jgi:8-oxo-dGTP pyrophosphatase MutT (NUDIX family)
MDPLTQADEPADYEAQYAVNPGQPLLLHSNRIFSVIFDGNTHFIQYNICDEGAIVVPRFANGDFLLVQLQRAPAFGMSTEFPRGGIERNEAPAAGALRELREETGYRVDPDSVTYLGRLGGDTAALNHIAHVFLVDIAPNATPSAYDENEIAGHVRVSQEQLKQMVKDNLIVDGYTLAALGMMFARVLLGTTGPTTK